MGSKDIEIDSWKINLFIEEKEIERKGVKRMGKEWWKWRRKRK